MKRYQVSYGVLLGILTLVACSGPPTVSPQQIQTEVAHAPDSQDNFYVPDNATGRVQEFNSSGALIAKWSTILP